MLKGNTYETKGNVVHILSAGNRRVTYAMKLQNGRVFRVHRADREIFTQWLADQGYRATEHGRDENGAEND